MAKTILLADDSVTIQKVVELTFMDEDYAVVAVSDGVAALEKIPEVDPDLVIADVHMPGADGYEVCRQTKASHPSIPVLLLVGTFEQFDEARAKAAGADGHLKKPFDSQELLSQVESLISSSPPVDADPQAGVPTAEFPLADFAPPPQAAPPPAADPFADEPAFGDLEPPPPYDEALLELDDTRPTAARPPEDSGEHFELVEADAGEELEPVAEPEPVGLEAPPPGVPEAVAAEAVAAEAADPEAAAAEAATPAAAAEAEGEAAAASANGALSGADVERIARRVAELVGEKMLREVAWEVVPDLAEVIIKERIRELESQVE